MPVEVRYGPDVANVAALAALTQSLAAQRATAGGGGGGGQRRSAPRIGSLPAMPQSPIPVGPAWAQQLEQERLREQVNAQLDLQRFGLPLELEEKRQQAKLDVENWEAKYTAQQRTQIASDQNALRAARESGQFSDGQLRAIEQMLHLKWAGLEPQLLPKTSQQAQIDAWTRQGQAPGQQYIDEWGNVCVRELDGTPKVQVAFDKTQAGVQAALEAKQRESWGRLRSQLAMQKLSRGGVGGGEQLAFETAEEIEARMMAIDPEYAKAKQEQAAEALAIQQEQAQQQAQLVEQQARIAETIPYWQRARAAGWRVEESDLTLPDVVQRAVIDIRAMVDRFGTDAQGRIMLPGGMYDAKLRLVEASSIVRQYQEYMQQQREAAADPPMITEEEWLKFERDLEKSKKRGKTARERYEEALRAPPGTLQASRVYREAWRVAAEREAQDTKKESLEEAIAIAEEVLRRRGS